VDEPFYTAACLEPLLDRWRDSIAGAAFPRGFFDWQRVKSSLQLYGMLGTSARVVRMARASIGGGSVHRQFTSRGIAVVDVDDVNARPFLDEVEKLRVDLIVSLNCPQKLKRAILSLPALGCINVHFGKLPKYRGILPIFYALLNRETSFGVTIHMMDEKLDNGEIVAQREVAIVPGDTLETLYPKGFEMASRLLNEALEAFSTGRVELLPNRESEKSYYSYPTRRMIREYHRLVRG
jgi:methionyl-tRNA formyltransferase